jgi:hypothetical protein
MEGDPVEYSFEGEQVEIGGVEASLRGGGAAKQTAAGKK